MFGYCFERSHYLTQLCLAARWSDLAFLGQFVYYLKLHLQLELQLCAQG